MATEREIKLFLQQYIETALWSSTGENDAPLDDDYGPEDIAEETLAQMRKECTSFLEMNAKEIGVHFGDAGHNFWLTRNGHGAGFWDSHIFTGEVGQQLTKAAHAWGSADLYIGDDGKVYQS